MRRRIALVLLASLLGAGTAQAHPHVWIDANVTFVFADRMLTAMRLEWSFDEIFSTLVIREHDKNRNKKLEPAEIEAVRTSAFIATKDYSFFTHVSLDGAKAPMSDARDFSAEIVKGKLVYRFTLPFAQPVDPAVHAIAVRPFDESYYVDVALENADPVRFSAMPNGLCYFEIGIEPSDLGAFGLSEIKKVELICPKS